MAGSQSNTMLLFSFNNYCQWVSQSDCINLYFHQWQMRVPVAPHPCRHLECSSFISALPVDVEGTVLCFNSPFPDEWWAEPLFIRLLAMWISSSMKKLVQAFCAFPSMAFLSFSYWYVTLLFYIFCVCILWQMERYRHRYRNCCDLKIPGGLRMCHWVKRYKREIRDKPGKGHW